LSIEYFFGGQFHGVISIELNKQIILLLILLLTFIALFTQSVLFLSAC